LILLSSAERSLVLFIPIGRRAWPALRYQCVRALLLFVGTLATGVAGCGTTRVTSTQRTATEQLLISNAVDGSVSLLDFRVLAGKPVFFDAQYVGAGPEQGYLVSSLRQHLLACGCLLQEDRAKATYVVEARAGCIGTNLNQVLIGVPQMNLPTVLPGQPSLIPEIPFAKKTDQTGVAKIAVFAFNRRTGQSVWQSGAVQTESTSKDTWVLGTGPFRRGTLGEATEFAGQQIAIPLLSGKEEGKEEAPPVLAVTKAAMWKETLATPSVDPSRVASLSAIVAQSAKSAGTSAPDKKAETAPANPGGQITADIHLEPLRLTGFTRQVTASQANTTR
jgi:hypothetical protein